MNISVLAAFWAVSFLFVITPGVDWAYAIAAGLRGRVVVPAVAGMLSGHLLATVLVAAGVGGVLVKVPYALSTLTLLGAGYLLWLGINMLLKPSPPVQGAAADGRWSRWAFKGLCVSGLNPKVLLLFLALLPQFTNPLAAWPVSLQIVALGTLHAFSCAVVYLTVGFGARAVLSSRPSVAIVVSRVSGAAMIVIAVLLAGERLLT